STGPPLVGNTDLEAINREPFARVGLPLTNNLPLKGFRCLETGAENTVGCIWPAHRKRLGVDGVLSPSGDERADIGRMRLRFLRSHEPCPYPHAVCSGCKCSRHGPPGPNTAGCQNRYVDRVQHLAQQGKQSDPSPDM